MNAMEVRGLYKTYPSFALKDVGFCVQKGHVAGLIGRNGAGKTTVLKACMNLISATGSVRYFGEELSENEKSVKQKIGFIGGGFSYYPQKKLRAVAAAFSAFYDGWDQARYEDFLHRFSLDADKKIAELSEGMKVKFFLALALSHGAQMLVLDEPTSGLDPLSREEFCDIVLSLASEQGVSVLFSTHITSDLMRIADDVIYISEGEVLAEKPLCELLGQYEKAFFPDMESALKAKGVIGAKPVKNGAEGLVLRGTAGEFRREKADLDAIMIHLETERKKIC